LRLQEEINAVKNKIKPGIFNIYRKKFDQQMILQYLENIKREHQPPVTEHKIN
jgi:hypothetical protein